MSRGTILIVDDDLESLKLLTRSLEAAGYQVRPADSGELALESVQANPPDLILLDIRMPGLDGFEVCRRLKQAPETRSVPVIFISGAAELDERVEGLRLGAVDFISKPVHNEELLARVKTHVELGQLRAELEARVADRTAELVTANAQLELDIAKRIAAETALRESEERFRNLADTAPVMIWVSGADKLCTFFSKRWLMFTGRTMEQELGNGWAEGVHPDDLTRCLEIYTTSFDARRNFQREYRLRRADGEYRWLLDIGTPHFRAGNIFLGYIGSCIDITDLKRSQEELIETQKLESLGVLAAGIVHDFNNMLGGMSAEVELALSQIPVDSPLRGGLDRIVAIAMHGSEVLNLIMDYAGSKDDKAKSEPVDLSLLIAEMIEFVKLSISKKAVLETSLAQNLCPVLANPTQIRRLIMSLLTNASEALGDREGFIRVTTSIASVDRRSLENCGEDLPHGTYALLEVTDSGCGMGEQERSKIFDPFYTTKSHGRGLGLSAVRGILRSHRGAVRVVSAPGKGCSFRVFLPCRALPAKHQTQTLPLALKSSRNGETVLLVEDEEPLRLAATLSLQKNGYSVIATGDGHEAVELFRGRRSEIDVVLLDLTLPGLSGADVFRELRQMKHGAKVIMTSAYDQQRVLGNSAFANENVFRFIRKPYRINDLIRVLQEARQTGSGSDSGN